MYAVKALVECHVLHVTETQPVVVYVAMIIRQSAPCSQNFSGTSHPVCATSILNKSCVYTGDICLAGWQCLSDTRPCAANLRLQL